MTRLNQLPHTTMQSVSVACIPNRAVGSDLPRWLSARPVAAAVMTLRQKGDGSIKVEASTMSDRRASEFPLPWLIERSLIPDAITLITKEDRGIVAVDACDRRFFAEPILGALVSGNPLAVDVGDMIEPSGGTAILRALAKRLRMPPSDNDCEYNEKLWQRAEVSVLEERALGAAMSQLLIWSTIAATRAAEPALFFGPALAVREWLLAEPDKASRLQSWILSKPLMRAISYRDDYLRDLERRRDGLPRTWPSFADGLFHT